MAKKLPRKLKQTVRQKVSIEEKPTKKSRVLSKTASTASKPIKATGRGVKLAFKPFSFLLKPFKTRPMRFVGRWLSRLLLINYFRNSWNELKQVTWPNRKQTTQLTIAVFVFALTFAVMITIVDYGLDKLFRKVLLK